MAPPMDELDTLLQSLQALKPPGVTKTKIEAITTLCANNVQHDSIIVQRIFQQFKRSPATHKLGVLYVVDSVTRRWWEKAREANQAVSQNATEGTYASGIQKVTMLLPSLMNELIQAAPENQRDKISKLIDIWERGQTFPLDKLHGFRQTLNKLQQAAPESFTPEGSPPKNGFNSSIPAAQAPAAPGAAPPVAAPVPDAASILAALAKIGTQNTATVGPSHAATVNQPQAAFPPAAPALPPPVAAPSAPQVVNMPIPPAAPPALPPALPPPTNPELLAALVQGIASGLIPPDQAMQFMALMAANQVPGSAPPVPPPPAPAQPAGDSSFKPPVQQTSAQPPRFDQNGGRYRDRSRSPGYDRRYTPDRRSPPHRRNSPVYGTYEPTSGDIGNHANRSEYDRPQRGRGRGRGGRNEYRQRSPPPRRQRSPGVPHNMSPKFLEFDRSLPHNHIKVLSRTLFVGGANGSEADLRNIFGRFGAVQTCIVNFEKHHAFVKMATRHDALAAKNGMDNCQDPEILNKARQTKWGVGFGPRDCSDYVNGVSIIDIGRLTDADMKWVHTAEHGGTGGRPLESGMVIEEPDIEIGAGVSSKAMSRRLQFQETRGRGGHNNHFAPRGGGHQDHSSRFRKPERLPQEPPARRVSPRPDAAVAPPVPGFGFQLPGSGF